MPALEVVGQMRDAAVVRTESLTKRYGRLLALDRLALQVRAGEVLGFLGPNGAGKTTTLRLLMGFLRPTSGSARVHGLDAWRDRLTSTARSASCRGATGKRPGCCWPYSASRICSCSMSPPAAWTR